MNSSMNRSTNPYLQAVQYHLQKSADTQTIDDNVDQQIRDSKKLSHSSTSYRVTKPNVVEYPAPNIDIESKHHFFIKPYVNMHGSFHRKARVHQGFSLVHDSVR
eukprot:CAMPEP_0117427174 /NCGR_PEP_ID=MMETSP0758-20121206/7088_1 /TAXON_ID=63605 /ORGANISM="Percolomonas cosmopolitus, Strain AE-1 (ATCC 50343)" /LENGTH=103 /DNA_ID=CAMNT_0005212679 /DNA_START=151 /DNA_END=459 /DNA_ORIENTATION=+